MVIKHRNHLDLHRRLISACVTLYLFQVWRNQFPVLPSGFQICTEAFFLPQRLINILIFNRPIRLISYVDRQETNEHWYEKDQYHDHYDFEY